MLPSPQSQPLHTHTPPPLIQAQRRLRLRRSPPAGVEAVRVPPLLHHPLRHRPQDALQPREERGQRVVLQQQQQQQQQRAWGVCWRGGGTHVEVGLAACVQVRVRWFPVYAHMCTCVQTSAGDERCGRAGSKTKIGTRQCWQGPRPQWAPGHHLRAPGTALAPRTAPPGCSPATTRPPGGCGCGGVWAIMRVWVGVRHVHLVGWQGVRERI